MDRLECPASVAGLSATGHRRRELTAEYERRKESCGDRIRTCDLEVMSLASYRAAPPRDMLCCLLLGKEPAKMLEFSHLIIRTDLIGIPMTLSVS